MCPLFPFFSLCECMSVCGFWVLRRYYYLRSTRQTRILIKLQGSVRGVTGAGKFHSNTDHQENYRTGIWSSSADDCYSSPDRLPGDQRTNTKGRRGVDDQSSEAPKHSCVRNWMKQNALIFSQLFLFFLLLFLVSRKQGSKLWKMECTTD